MNAVIGAPAWFLPSQLIATEAAAYKAGLELVQIANEPELAARAHGTAQHDERLANLKAEVALLRGENARLRRALDGDSLDVEALQLRIAAFAKERDWDQFHTPRNILLAPVHKSTDTPSSRRRVDGVEVDAKNQI